MFIITNQHLIRSFLYKKGTYFFDELSIGRVRVKLFIVKGVVFKASISELF